MRPSPWLGVAFFRGNPTEQICVGASPMPSRAFWSDTGVPPLGEVGMQDAGIPLTWSSLSPAQKGCSPEG